jgi:hypothetical protein
MARSRPALWALFGALGAVGYALLAHRLFGRWPSYGTVTLGFLCLVPLALGALTVYTAPDPEHLSRRYACFMPWWPCLVFVVLAVVLGREAWICVVMAVPLVFPFASLGGLVMREVLRYRDETGRRSSLVMAVLLVIPYAVTPLEGPPATQTRTVHARTVVEAPLEVVWGNIIRFRAVTPDEHRPSLFHLAGLPRPVSATLSREGLGGIRRGQWEDGLAFNGTVTEWEPPRSYALRLSVERGADAPAPPLLWAMGDAFEVLGDRYVLEPIGERRVVLHLITDHRLTAHVGWYGALWTDLLMHDLQMYILRLVKARCERGGPPV